MVYKILLAEDEPTMRRLMSMLLTRGGHEVIEADNGEPVVNLAIQNQPDLILLDIMMPGVDGYEALRRVRSSPMTADIPVIFLSAKSQVEDRVEGLRLGADDYVVKPADPDELMARIEAVMSRTRKEARRRKGKVMGFVGAKGGVGTSTAVVNLGAYLLGKAQDTILLDLHLAFGTLADQLHLAPPKRTTANLAMLPPEEINAAAIQQTLLRHPSGLQLLASPDQVPAGVTFSAEHLMATVEQASYLCQYLLIDLPQDPDIIEVVADQINGVILVLGSEPASLRSGVRIARHLGHLGLHNRLSTLLISRERSDQQYVTSGVVADKLPCLHLGSIPAKPELYLKADYTHTPLLLNGHIGSEQVIYDEIGRKLLSYMDTLDQFQKDQLMKSDRLA